MTFSNRLKAGRSMRQRGVSMLFALMTLVALSLAAVALVRNVDTGAMIIGNMGFKQDTVMASDEGMRRAMAFVTAGQVDDQLGVSRPTDGYYINDFADLDVAGTTSLATRNLVDWKLDGCKGYDPKPQSSTNCILPNSAKIELPNGVWARYIVMKVCSTVGATVDCLGPVSQKSESTSESGELKYTESEYAKSKGAAVYYRIIVRTEGAREAVTYAEALAHNYEGEEK